MFQDDFCQQVFEALVEILRKESQNRFSRGQVAEGHQPGEAVQGLEQLQGRQSGHGWVRRVRVGAEDGRECVLFANLRPLPCTATNQAGPQGCCEACGLSRLLPMALGMCERIRHTQHNKAHSLLQRCRHSILSPENEGRGVSCAPRQLYSGLRANRGLRFARSVGCLVSLPEPRAVPLN